MTVQELIEELKNYPPDAIVGAEDKSYNDYREICSSDMVFVIKDKGEYLWCQEDDTYALKVVMLYI